MAQHRYPDTDMLALGVARALTGALRQTLAREDAGASLVASGEAETCAVLEALSAADLDWARVRVIAARASYLDAVAGALSRGPAAAAGVAGPGPDAQEAPAPSAVLLGAEALGLPAGHAPPPSEGAFAAIAGTGEQAVTLPHLARSTAIHLVLAGEELAALAEAAGRNAPDLGPALARLAPEAVVHIAP